MLLFRPGLGASGLTAPSPALPRAILSDWVVPIPLKGLGERVRHLELGVGSWIELGAAGSRKLSWSGFGYKAVQGVFPCHPKPRSSVQWATAVSCFIFNALIAKITARCRGG